ncbi:MAG: hypothetical protein IJY74_04910 [Oscillospiraceae bacterium]|nr:hypothetical protein [Oscillospiraceae bacterium]
MKTEIELVEFENGRRWWDFAENNFVDRVHGFAGYPIRQRAKFILPDGYVVNAEPDGTKKIRSIKGGCSECHIRTRNGKPFVLNTNGMTILKRLGEGQL